MVAESTLCKYIACIYLTVSVNKFRDAISKNTHNSRGTGVIIYTDLSGTEAHRQTGVDKMIASGSIGSVIVNALA